MPDSIYGPFDAPGPAGFPIHPLVWHPIRTRMTADRAPGGRVIGVEYTWDYQPSEPEFQAELGKSDVVWVPLYTGTIDSTPRSGNRPRHEYETNLKAIAAIGPRVHAILTGNANAEICWDCNLRTNHARCVEFVRRHGAMVRPHARPAFAPVFDILVYDACRAGGALQKALNDLDALVIAYAASKWLFEALEPWIPEARPWPTLTAYLAAMEVWGGVGMLRGLRAGSGEALQSMGVRAGIMGYF